MLVGGRLRDASVASWNAAAPYGSSAAYIHAAATAIDARATSPKVGSNAAVVSSAVWFESSRGQQLIPTAQRPPAQNDALSEYPASP